MKKLIDLTLIVLVAVLPLLVAGCLQQPEPTTTVTPPPPAATGPSPASTSPLALAPTRALPPASSPAPAPTLETTPATLPTFPTPPTLPTLPTLPTPPAPVLTPTPGPTPVPLPESVAETIDGWAFQRIDLPQASLHFQSGIAPEALDRGLPAIPLAASRVPRWLSAQSLPRIHVYFFRSADEFRRGLAELAKASRGNLSATLRGFSITSGRHPGTYHDASEFTDTADTVRTVAHEFTHQVERGMA